MLFFVHCSLLAEFMAILDIFKKKEKPSFTKATKGKEKKEVKEKPKKPKAVEGEKKKDKQKVPTVDKPRTKRKKKFIQAYKVLKAFHITEKATDLTKENKYIFKVWQETNKVEIKQTVEGLYDVDVVSVKIINIPPKRRRLGRTAGWRKGYKKAIVKSKEGQKIEVLPR